MGCRAQRSAPGGAGGRHKLIACHRRRQGLIVAHGNPLGLAGVGGLARAGLRFINRQPGSGTRLLTEHLLAEAVIAPEHIAGFHGPCEDTHVAVAAAVASGVADAGVGIEAAAVQFGLGFVPLAAEGYYLVCLKEALDRAAIVRLRELLSSAPWAAAVHSLAGCTVAPDAGQVLALTQALPWWHYRKPRQR